MRVLSHPGTHFGRATAVLFASAWLAGCSCNENEYSFGELDRDVQEPPVSIGSWLSFDLAPGGDRLTMAYYDRFQTGVAWAVGSVNADGTVSWAHERVDGYPDENGLDTADRGRYATQRTAPDGTVWVAYHDAKAGTLRASRRTAPNTWEEPVVIDTGIGLPGVGLWASLAIGDDGFPLVAHCDPTRGVVRLSRFDGTAWSTSDLYTSQPVDSVDAQGYPVRIPAGVGYTDLLVSGGQVHVAFQDTATGDLHLVTDGADSIVDAEGNVGAWPSLWSNGTKMRIAYQDVDRQDLLLATRQEPSGSWDIGVIDDGEMRGADTELLEIDGEPAIVYFDGYDNDSWLARRANGSEWSFERVGEDGHAVGFHNEAIVAGGRLWVGSYDFTSDALFLKSL